MLADAFEARGAFRAVFIRPNSFAGILARGEEPGLYRRYGFALLAILPSLVLGVVIGWALRRKALRLGESAGTGRLWFGLGLLFGIPAWITFAVVRSREAMVTCGNCGSLRRPDAAVCHACRARWDLSHLEAPAWRVVEPVCADEARETAGAVFERQDLK